MKKELDADDFEDTRDVNKEDEEAGDASEKNEEAETGDLGVEALIDASEFFSFSVIYPEVMYHPSLDDAFDALVGKYGYESTGKSFASGNRLLTFRKML